MKKILLSLNLVLLAGLSFAQWTTSGANIYYNSGNVGVGTTSPLAPLHVNGFYFLNRPATMVDNMSTLGVPNGSYLGIAPTDFSATNNSYMLLFFPDNNSFRIGTGYDGHLATGGVFRDIQFGRYYQAPYLTIKDGGNILIGKTSQANTSYILDVNGTARSNKLVVNSTGADFVFERGYHLSSLQGVEKYIQTFHHLEGIATARQMQEEGIDLGENQTRLLQKIEELTLYVIEQQKQIKVLQKENKKIKNLEVQVYKLAHPR